MSGNLVKGLAVAGLFCLGSIQAVKADTLPPGPSYTATINYVGTNPTSEIWNNAASVVESVTFTNIGGVVGIQIGTYPASTPGNGQVNFSPPNCTATSCLPTSSPFFAFVTNTGNSLTGLTIGGTNAAPTITSGATGAYNAPLDQLCTLNNLDNFNACNTGSSPTINVSYIGGLFKVTDDSLAFTFTLNSVPTNTPEASTLVTLGAGLLGLVGFELRRRCIA
jgi:hypothetical protein